MHRNRPDKLVDPRRLSTHIRSSPLEDIVIYTIYMHSGVRRTGLTCKLRIS